MNIAFSALLLSLFLLPGFVFSVAFYNVDNRPLNYVSLTHKAVVSLFVTCVMHFIWLLTVHSLHYNVDFHLILTLISGSENTQYSQAIQSISLSDIINFFAYFITIYIFAFSIGKIFRYLIKKLKLDRFPFFRLETKWHYLFGGHDWEKGQPDGVIIAATHELAGKGFLYLGLLKNFHLNDDGDLDRLILTSVGRRDINNDKNYPDEGTGERFYHIDGDCLILKYSEIKTLNVQYLKIEKI